VTVVTTYLEMRDPAALRPGGAPRVAAELRTVHDPAVNRACYETIGADWAWNERLAWSERRWAAYAAGVETLLAVAEGLPAGYAELQARAGTEVEIAMFGVRRELHGLGVGGWLLTEATRRAWALHPEGTRRVWLHTCTLDGPHALANYEARGFVAYDRVTSLAP
jgi:GNAT superfamily N-acetyltransferase